MSIFKKKEKIHLEKKRKNTYRKKSAISYRWKKEIRKFIKLNIKIIYTKLYGFFNTYSVVDVQ